MIKYILLFSVVTPCVIYTTIKPHASIETRGLILFIYVVLIGYKLREGTSHLHSD